MKRVFAVPTIDGKACLHFGHCQSFAVLDVEEGAITQERYLTPPAHQPGSHPRFLAEMGVNIIIAGGMGAMAQNLFKQNNIEVHMGVAEAAPAALVQQYLQDQLTTGVNLCNHDDDHEGHHCHD